MKSNTIVRKTTVPAPVFFLFPAAVIFYWILIMQLVIKIKLRVNTICNTIF